MKRCRYAGCSAEFQGTWSRLKHEIEVHGKKAPAWFISHKARKR